MTDQLSNTDSTSSSNTSSPKHFEGKDAIGHVVEKQARGLIESRETHGVEMPGHLYAGCDAARGFSVISLLFILLVSQLLPELSDLFPFFLIFFLGTLLWKSGRAAWLAWDRLERLHRLMEEERWEIENHRSQEREELQELYRAKGFEGELLEEVVDVLMADGDRLLRVMLEEEMGLSLGVHQHPLKQGLGAAIGIALSFGVLTLGLFTFLFEGVVAASLSVVALTAGMTAYYERNRIIPAVVWNMGLAILSFGSVYFLTQFFLG